MFLQKISLTALEGALNQFLQLDQQTVSGLRSLAGKVICLRLMRPRIHFNLLIEPDQIRLSKLEQEADTEVRVPFFTLLKLKANPNTSLNVKDLSLSGDIHLLEALLKLFKRHNPDWTGFVAEFLGDNLAQGMSSFVQKRIRTLKHHKNEFKLNLAEYLKDEVQVVPSRIELEKFYRQVDELNLRYERLASKVAQLTLQDVKRG